MRSSLSLRAMISLISKRIYSGRMEHHTILFLSVIVLYLIILFYEDIFLP